MFRHMAAQVNAKLPLSSVAAAFAGATPHDAPSTAAPFPNPPPATAGATGPLGKSKRTKRAEVPDALADLALIDGPSIAAAACISYSQFLELVRCKLAPQPAVRGPRCTRWRVSAARRWLVEFAEGGDQQVGA